LLDGGPLYIGQNVDLTGNIVAGEGLIGVLSRFNVWLQQLYPSEVETFSKQCGGEVGDLVSWPEVKYYVVGDVELTSGTTCVKPGGTRLECATLFPNPWAPVGKTQGTLMEGTRFTCVSHMIHM
jgi:hypothetical protein